MSILRVGQIVKHFKGNLYVIEGLAEHTERIERLVIYRNIFTIGDSYARPVSLFLGEAPQDETNITGQKYRFERCGSILGNCDKSFGLKPGVVCDDVTPITATNVDISKLGLPSRVINILTRAGVHHIDKLEVMSPSELESIDNMNDEDIGLVVKSLVEYKALQNNK